MYIPQGIAVEFNTNVQMGINGNTTQFYQNTTKGCEFTDANFKIKAQSKIAKGDREKSAIVIYLVCTAPIHLGVHIYEVI